MRILLSLVFLAFAANVFSQSETQPAAATSEFLNTKFWSELGKPTEGPKGFSLFSRNIQPKSDTLFQLWLKVVPNDSAQFNRRYTLPRDTAFVVRFATIDCSRRTVVFEQTSAYDGSKRSLDARSSELVKNESRLRVQTGSIADSAFQYVCVKLPEH